MNEYISETFLLQFENQQDAKIYPRYSVMLLILVLRHLSAGTTRIDNGMFCPD